MKLTAGRVKSQGGVVGSSANLRQGSCSVAEERDGALLRVSLYCIKPYPVTLKVYSNELFLFQLTNDLCTSFTKLIIILFLSKELCYFNILC